MKPIFLLLLFGLIGCTTAPEQCWTHSQGNQNFTSDNYSCQALGDTGGAYLTGGMMAAAAANRKYGFCMQGKGYYLTNCKSE